MPKQLTFIHAADLHIGAPFRGLRALSETWANRLLSAIPESYDRVIEAALSHQVDFVVMAGDIFDNARTSYADYLHFFEGLKKLDQAGIPAFLTTGNHDPYTMWQQDFYELPPSATMFSATKPSFAVFEKNGEPLAVLGGRGYYNQTWSVDEDIAEGITRAAAEEATATHPPFAIGVLHTGLNLDPAKAPVDPAELLQANMDYWALGHIHMKYVLTEEDPRIVFSGCIQGRDVRETGERGVYKVTLTEGETNRLEFIPTASVVWQRMKIDIADCMSLGEVTEKVMRELFLENGKARCDEMCVRITLKGKTNLHKVLANPAVLEDLRTSINDSYPSFFCDALIDKTEYPLDKQALVREGLFPAALMQVADVAREEIDEQIGYLQDEFMKKGFRLPRTCEKDAGKLIGEAEDLVLDLLNQGDVR